MMHRPGSVLDVDKAGWFRVLFDEGYEGVRRIAEFETVEGNPLQVPASPGKNQSKFKGVETWKSWDPDHEPWDYSRSWSQRDEVRPRRWSTAWEDDKNLPKLLGRSAHCDDHRSGDEWHDSSAHQTSNSNYRGGDAQARPSDDKENQAQVPQRQVIVERTRLFDEGVSSLKDKHKESRAPPPQKQALVGRTRLFEAARGKNAPESACCTTPSLGQRTVVLG